jgi:hypothetical protein
MGKSMGLKEEARANVEELLAEDHELFKLMNDVRKKLNSGFYTPELVAAIMQYHPRAKQQYDLVDAYFFTLIWAGGQEEKILILPVLAHGVALNNKDADGNNRVLMDTFPSDVFEHKFHGEVGGGADNDGYISWKSHEWRFYKLEESHKFVQEGATLSLEVGTTDAWTTYRHLTFEGKLARLPYRSKHFYLFFVMDNSWRPPTFAEELSKNLAKDEDSGSE